MKWSETAWNNAEHIYNKILDLPFIKDLLKGVLTEERFKFYIIQDSLYISEYCKLLTNISKRLSNPEHSKTFMQFADDGVEVEKILHSIYLKGYKPSKTEMNFVCKIYTSYFENCLKDQNIEIALAAALPCFWVYQKVGEYIYKNAEKNNKYQDWINAYADEGFAESTRKAIDICDEMADNCTDNKVIKEMTDVYEVATFMELQFWSSAYNLK